MDYRLLADLLGRVVLFIGYSFGDPNVSYLFRLFMNSQYGRPGGLAGTRAFIVVADPTDFETRLFQARRIEVIPIDGLHKEDAIVNLLNDMREGVLM